MSCIWNLKLLCHNLPTIILQPGMWQKIEGEKIKPRAMSSKWYSFLCQRTRHLSRRQIITNLLLRGGEEGRLSAQRPTNTNTATGHISHMVAIGTTQCCQCIGPSFLFALGCLLLPLTSSILGLVQFLGASVQLSNPKGLFLLSEFAVFLVSLAGTWIVLTHETLGGNRAAHPCSRMCFHSLFPFPQHSVFLLPFPGSITQPLWANSLC